MSRLLVVGGSDAGVSAALRARELDPAVEVSVLVADRYPNYSICGLPYALSGEVAPWDALAHRTAAELEGAGVELLLEHTADEVDADARIVMAHDAEGRQQQLRYDTLIIATGAAPVRPLLPGIDLPGVHQLHTVSDGLALDKAMAAGPDRAVIVGAGYIGLEMAEALQARGLFVTMVEQLPQVLPTVDAGLAVVVAEELERHEVAVRTGLSVTEISAANGRLAVHGRDGTVLPADLVLVAVGVRPEAELGRRAGVDAGERGALRVDRRMATNVPGVLACGDCAVTYHRLLQRDAYLPLGSTAHKQGRVAGENAVGGDRLFGGSLGTQVVRVFELVAARTGLLDAEAQEAGLDPVTVEWRAPDHTAYYPGAHEITMRLTGDRASGRLLGAQLAGHVDAEIPKRIDIVATALFSDLGVDALEDLDLSYTPPFGTPWDAVQAAGQAWTRTTSAPRPRARP